jgi:predicted N-acetyltransferase YhbS
MPVPLSALQFRNEDPADHVAVEALLDRVFGPGRFTKVSERVREVAQARPDLSFCAWRGDVLAGVVRQWGVRVGGRPTIFLGPLAVDEDQRLGGLGGALVERACAAAGAEPVLLVGDEPYFTRFGFSALPARGVVLPGPVDQRRVLVRGDALSGLVTA